MMKTRSKIVLTACATSAICWGCASHKTQEEISKTFVTNISQSGLKHFEIRLRLPRELQALPPVEGHNQRPQGINYNKIYATLKSSADYAIEQNHYCRKDYWVIEESIDMKGPYLRGECNDVASDEDRKTFPDTLKRW